MRLRIDAVDLPGLVCPAATDHPQYRNVHVAVQRRNRPGELLGLVPGDAASASWTLDVVAKPTPGGFDVTGAYVQGGPGDRFVYLSWGTVAGEGGFAMFRRAKLMLGAVPHDVLAEAAGMGALVGRLDLTDARGEPLCARVVPPRITWSAERPG